MAEETPKEPIKRVYKMRMLMSVLYLFISPIAIVFLLAALLTINSADTAPGFIDWIVFIASVGLPFVLFVSAFGGMWCARGVRSARKNLFGKFFLFLPIVNVLLVALMYV